jgi:hypothetical protein
MPVFLAESARSIRWPHLKYARYSRCGRLEIASIALKNPSARVVQQAASQFYALALAARPDPLRKTCLTALLAGQRAKARRVAEARRAPVFLAFRTRSLVRK